MFTTPETLPSREIKSLTSLRGVAALAVVLQHFSATAQTHSSGWIPSIVPHGYMAVDFFFVLSGFIMSYTYLAAFQAQGFKAYGPFLLKRVARIVPLGVAVTAAILTLGAVVAIWGRSDLFINFNAVRAGLTESVLINVLHLQGFLNTYNLNDPSWSVSVELGTYLVFPILVYLIFNGPQIACAAYILAGTFLLVGVAITQPRLGLGVRSPLFDMARCLAEFGYGMLTYRVFETQGKIRVLGTDGWTWSITAFACGMLLLRVDLLIALSFPLLVLTWAWNQGSASRIMSSSIPYFLGIVSFSLYLVHHLFRRPELELLQFVFPQPVSPTAALAFALAGSLSIIPTAMLAYRFVERPGRDTINNLTRRLSGASGK